MACSIEPWMFKVRPGHHLVPNPRYNEMLGDRNKLKNPSLVEAVTPFRNCQSGVLFTVGGRQLDAAWFLEPEDDAK